MFAKIVTQKGIAIIVKLKGLAPLHGARCVQVFTLKEGGKQNEDIR